MSLVMYMSFVMYMSLVTVVVDDVSLVITVLVDDVSLVMYMSLVMYNSQRSPFVVIDVCRGCPCRDTHLVPISHLS
jgi:hypothetical protein